MEAAVMKLQKKLQENDYLRDITRQLGRMKEVFLKSHYIHCDESRIQVLGEPEQEGSTRKMDISVLIITVRNVQ